VKDLAIKSIRTGTTIGLVLMAGVVGGIVGGLTATRMASTSSKSLQKIALRELLLLDEKNRPAIRLSSVRGRSVLEFLSQNEKTQVEVGVDQNKRLQFVNFIGSTGFSTMSLHSGFPNGEAALALGDDYFEGRTVLGAQPSDISLTPGTPVVPGSGEWGLRFSRLGQLSPVIYLLVTPKGSNLKSGIWIEQNKGLAWTAP